MSISTEDLLKVLSYEGCNCPPDRKPDLGVINGKCPKHRGQLLIEGVPVEEYVRRVRLKLRQLD